VIAPDLFIVLTSLIDYILPAIFAVSLGFNTSIFRLLRILRAVRAIRVLRVLRTISFLKSLQSLVSTILKSLPAMGNIVFLMLIIQCGWILLGFFFNFFYMRSSPLIRLPPCTPDLFSIIGASTYKTIDPYRFGSIGQSFFQLFQVLTLDNWHLVYKDNRDKDGNIYIFVYLFIVFENFVLLKYVQVVTPHHFMIFFYFGLKFSFLFSPFRLQSVCSLLFLLTTSNLESRPQK
jgi:cation channel sperm-associated protein 1